MITCNADAFTEGKGVLASEIKKGIDSFNTEKTFSVDEVREEIALNLKKCSAKRRFLCKRFSLRAVIRELP